MTDKLKHHSASISQALSNKDFESLFRLFTTEKFSATELLVFYKRNKDIFNSETFWASQLPHFHLQSIIESDFKITFIQSYFSSDLNCSHDLNNHLVSISKSDFIKFTKLWQVFNHSSFYKSVKELSKNDSELERFVKELDIIIKAQEKLNAEAKADEKYLLQFTFGEIAVAFSLYYYEFKQSDQILANKKLQTQIEMALVDELNNIISLFNGKSNMAFQFENNDELQKQFQRNEAPHHILGKKGLDIPLEPKFQLLYSLIKRLIERNGWKGQIHLYLCGYFDFETVILNPAPLQSNNNYRVFKINNSKSTPEELFFSELRFDFSKPQNLSKTNIKSSLENLKFYGIPETITHNGNLIEIKKALQLLKYFSVHKGPKERQIFLDGKKTMSFVMNEGDKQFVELFGSNESITLFDFEKLSKGISTYFKWTEQETQSLLSFLTFEITSSQLSYSWVSRPFLKCKNQILWLGSFLKDRRWDNIFLNKFKRDNEFKSLVNTLSKNFEKKIEELFQSSSFKTISGVPFKSANGQTGDFDVLAFKNNNLIVCEAKTGIRSDDFFYAAKSEAVRLEGCAAGQLEKAIHNIKENWVSLKAKLEVADTTGIDDIKIIPLIVTDYFEGDLHLYKNSILKTSLIELEVNLKNKKKDLLEMYMIMQFHNELSKDLKEKRNIPSNWDLWNGAKECSVENLIQNIQQNTIWKVLESVWKFDNEKYLLDY